jgi:hypothetical protein
MARVITALFALGAAVIAATSLVAIAHDGLGITLTGIRLVAFAGAIFVGIVLAANYRWNSKD